jgi:hypothetical protein
MRPEYRLQLVKVRPVKVRWSDERGEEVCGRCGASGETFDYYDPPLEGKYFARCHFCGSRLKRK